MPAENSAATDETFTISRTFDAPRALVWQAWTDADHLAKWWGPAGLNMAIKAFDFRPGGLFHYSMTLPDGRVMWGKFVYREIVPQQHIVFVNSFSDENAGITRNPFNPNWPEQTLSTVEFSEEGARTTVKLTGKPLNASELERKTFGDNHSSMQQGFKGTLDQLANHLAKA